MGRLVEVPDHGVVEFPDEMDDHAIAQAIQKNSAPSSSNDDGLQSALDSMESRAPQPDNVENTSRIPSLWESANTSLIARARELDPQFDQSLAGRTINATFDAFLGGGALAPLAEVSPTAKG